VERSNQDAKSEVGWDELEARKYRAWNQRLALTIMAMWLINLIKRDWANRYPRDAQLGKRLEMPELPELSVANVRELLKAVMPLEQLTPEQATNGNKPFGKSGFFNSKPTNGATKKARYNLNYFCMLI
jgi:hypothetical protein